MDQGLYSKEGSAARWQGEYPVKHNLKLNITRLSPIAAGRQDTEYHPWHCHGQPPRHCPLESRHWAETSYEAHAAIPSRGVVDSF